jgi:hypothetical protein
LRFEMLTPPSRGNFAALKTGGGLPRDRRQKKFGKPYRRRQ